MKRVFSILLIAFLLIFPVLSVQADDRPTYVFVDDGLLTVDELSDLNTRAFMISLDRHVGVYYFYYSDVEDLPSYVEQFASEHVAEKNALVLGFNADYYYFLQIGSVAKEALPDSVCESTILDAYRAVKGDPKGKLLAYLNTTDEILKEYRDTHGFPDVFMPVYDLSDVPEEIARTAGGKPTLVDKERLLTDSEAEALSVRLKEIGDAYRCDVVIVTVSTLGRKTSEAYADDFFDYNGYGYGAVPDDNGVTRDGNGILLLLSMEDRDFAISTSGYGIKAFTDYGIQTYLEPLFLPYLSSNDYSGGFTAFANGCDDLLKYASEGVPYDYRRIYIEGWTDGMLLSLNDRAESVANEYGVGIYYLENKALTDADAFAADFISRRLLDSSAVVLVNGQDGFCIRTVGSQAYAKFTDEKLTAVKETVAPYLAADDAKSAVNAYFDACYDVVSDYAHVLTGGALSETTRRSADNRLKELFSAHGVALYFLYDAEAADPEALAKSYLSDSVYESNAVVLGANRTGSAVAVKGGYAAEKFTDRRIAKLVKEVDPHLPEGDLSGAFYAFAERSEKIITWRPVNYLTLAISVIAGLLFGMIPANGLKRQLTSVSKQTNAEAYMQPQSFMMTQNSNVLLGKHLSRTVHVVQSSSSSGGGGRSGGGGSSFHGGSSTHTSSSGGTHGGHSGKF